MLEKERLLILPWSSTLGLPREDVAELSHVRRIQDLSGALLGFAGWRPQGWWRGKTIRVFEIPDASLLMTVHRPWGPMRMWQVADAEERCIGSCYRDILLDGDSHPLAHLQEETSKRRQKFLTRTRGELGTLEWLDDGGVRLSFQRTVNPFARMNLLGKVLCMPPLPGT